MDIACEYAGRDMPARIQRAITRLMDPKFPVELTAAEKVAFAALLRRVEAKDGTSSFWVLRANLGELFDRVERTVTNWLTGLADKGLLEKEQRRTSWGKFSCITLHLTDAAAQLLGLAESSPSPAPFPRSLKKTSAGHKEGFTKEQSYQRQQGDAPGLVDKSSTRVPADCRLLLEFGIRPSGIFALMKCASMQGNRLGDILAATGKDALKKAKSAYALVKHLAGVPRNFAAEAGQARATDEEAAARARIAAKKAELDNRWVVLDGTRKALCKASDVIPVYEINSAAGAPKYLYALAGTALVKFWESAVARDVQPEPI